MTMLKPKYPRHSSRDTIKRNCVHRIYKSTVNKFVYFRLVPPWLRRNAAQGRPVRPSTNQNAENMQNSSSSSQSVASPIQATPSNTTESVHQNVNTATEQPAESKSQGG